MIAASRKDSWALDEGARKRPLFPRTNARGDYDVLRSMPMEDVAKGVAQTGKDIGMHPHKLGVWSFRKDACQVVQVGAGGPAAARVLGHEAVDSRTMNRVYIADKSRTDHGACWRQEAPKTRDAPSMSLSACRVQAAGGVRSDLDLPRAGFAGYVEVEQGLFATRFAQVREEQRVAVKRAAAARQVRWTMPRWRGRLLAGGRLR